MALTFDDGPWPGATGKILQVLKRFDVPATFFEVGRQIAAHPRTVRKVAAAGDEVGNHTFDHPLSLKHHPAQQVAAEMWRTTNALAEEQVRPTLFRPPGGWYDDAMIQEARRQHMRVVLWDVDPKDWDPSVSAREIAHNVLSSAHAGSIVLLHDGGRERDRLELLVDPVADLLSAHAEQRSEPLVDPHLCVRRLRELSRVADGSLRPQQR